MRTHIADAVDGYQWADQLRDVQEQNRKMTDFSHLHELEERAVRIQERMIAVQNNDTQWKAQAVQLFQTEQEIADERAFLGLEDMDVDDLYAALFDEQEGNVVREITKTANEAEQAAAIRTAAEALVAKVKEAEYEEWAGNPNIVFADFIEVEIDALKAALSKGWLARKEPNSMCECGVSLYLHGSLTACCLPRMTAGDGETESLIGALRERSRLDPDAPGAVVIAIDQEDK